MISIIIISDLFMKEQRVNKACHFALGSNNDEGYGEDFTDFAAFSKDWWVQYKEYALRKNFAVMVRSF